MGVFDAALAEHDLERVAAAGGKDAVHPRTDEEGAGDPDLAHPRVRVGGAKRVRPGMRAAEL
jgi:hypothetical protein